MSTLLSRGGFLLTFFQNFQKPPYLGGGFIYGGVFIKRPLVPIISDSRKTLVLSNLFYHHSYDARSEGASVYEKRKKKWKNLIRSSVLKWKLWQGVFKLTVFSLRNRNYPIQILNYEIYNLFLPVLMSHLPTERHILFIWYAQCRRLCRINSLPNVQFSRLERRYQTPKEFKLALQKFKL